MKIKWNYWLCDLVNEWKERSRVDPMTAPSRPLARWPTICRMSLRNSSPLYLAPNTLPIIYTRAVKNHSPCSSYEYSNLNQLLQRWSLFLQDYPLKMVLNKVGTTCSLMRTPSHNIPFNASLFFFFYLLPGSERLRTPPLDIICTLYVLHATVTCEMFFSFKYLSIVSSNID